MWFIRIFFIGCLLASYTATAKTLPEQLKICAAVSADDKRLACYDTLSNSLMARAEHQFGIEAEQLVNDTSKHLTSTIANSRKGAYGKLTITLANGQVWRQTASSLGSWKSGEKVEIKRGALGSFLMRKHSGGKSVRVKRIK
ncbi:MAG: hypothetical protein K0U59_03290 [Gammaproteobacteria bacterium]|nr:hypothetical protein [Gammaproteobacteria bacterium]